MPRNLICLNSNPKFSSVLVVTGGEGNDTALEAQHGMSGFSQLEVAFADGIEALGSSDCPQDCATFVLKYGEGEDCLEQNQTLPFSGPVFYPESCLGIVQQQNLRLDSLAFTYQKVMEGQTDKAVISEVYSIKGEGSIKQFVANWTVEEGLAFSEREIWIRRQVCKQNNTRNLSS